MIGFWPSEGWMKHYGSKCVLALLEFSDCALICPIHYPLINSEWQTVYLYEQLVEWPVFSAVAYTELNQIKVGLMANSCEVGIIKYPP